MAWLGLALFSVIDVKVALTLLGALALYGATAASHREPQRQPALARIRRNKRPAAR
jgi:hypothetical protein